MNQVAVALKVRTRKFALDVLRFVRALPSLDDATIIGRQLIRSATGVASNYRSSCRARSRAEFIARINVALDEADESALRLEILIEAGIATGSVATTLLEEANQLTAICVQSSITATERLTAARLRK